MVILIREAKAEDRDAWLMLWKGYTEFAGCVLDDEITSSTWQRILSDDSQLLCHVAEVEKEIVGFSLCVLHEGTWVTKPICYLEDLYVEEKMRGFGIGQALIEALSDEGKSRGWAKVYWVTRATNPARKLYDKLAVVDDFVRYGIRF